MQLIQCPPEKDFITWSAYDYLQQKIHGHGLAAAEAIINHYFPSGSGFDANWEISEVRENSIKVKSSYHLMDEYGMYRMWIDFSVTLRNEISKQVGKYTSYDLTFQCNRTAYRWVENYHLREYMGDTIFHALGEMDKAQLHRREAEANEILDRVGFGK